jgi:RHS repeat-associated protein
MQEHCGVNDIGTRQSYDEFGRPVRRWERVPRGSAWGNDASAHVLWSYHPLGSINPNQNRYLVREWRAPRCYGNFVRRHYNGLGQLILEQRPDQAWEAVADGCGTSNLGKEIETHYGYDSLGNQTRLSAPILVDRTGYQNRPPNWNKGFTATTYDALNQPTQTTLPNGDRTVFNYSGRVTHEVRYDRLKVPTAPDAYKIIRWQEVNGLGYLRLVRSYTYTSSGWTASSQVLLSHDVMGNLTGVTHPASVGVTSLSYDLDGRKTGMSDPDLGTWSYSYDRQGKLTTQTDGCDNVTTLGYDKLQRLTGKSYTKGADPACNTANVAYNVSFTYDGGHSAGNPSRGHLTQVKYSDNSYQKNWQFWPSGQLQVETVKIAGGATAGYSTSYTYDGWGRLTTTTYPDGDNVSITYNSMGLPNWMNSNLSGNLVNGVTAGGGQANGVTYDEAGRLRQMRFPAGGNLWRTQKYAPFDQADSDGGMLDAIYVGTTSNNTATDYNRLRLEYDYDSFGNIDTLREGFNGGPVAPWVFSYDWHNRLESAFGRSYAYDTAGRLTSYEGSALGYDSVKTHAVNTVAGVDRYDYDTNGNMRTRNKGLSTQQTLGWNVENRLLSLVATGLVEWYYYDEHGQRVKRVSNGVTTLTPFPHYEVEINGSTRTVTKYYFFNGLRIAMKEGSTLTYLHPDHLGSTVLSTVGSAFQVGQGYYGYGNYRSGGALPTDHRYTGQKLDIATGLMDYGARYYDRTVGLFASPDTIVPDPTNVWDYHRCGYANLNPLKYNDPTGHCATNADGSENWQGEANTQCWQTAYAIYGYGASGFSAFAEDWQVTTDDWLENIAQQEFATTEYLQPFLEEYNSRFCAQSGLQCDEYHPDPAPLHPLEILCDTWDCPGVALDAGSLMLSAAGDVTMMGCVVATGGACVPVAIFFKAADAAVTLYSFNNALHQYYVEGSSSDADLAVALTDLAGLIPGVGEMSGIVSLGWGLVDPAIEDEKQWAPGVAK